MLLYALPAIAGVAMLGLTFQYDALRGETGSRPVLNRLDMVQHQQFLYAAAQYMASADAPTTPGTVAWDKIRAAPTTPPGMRTLGVPNGWRIVKTVDSWVACAEMSESAATAMNQFMPSTPAQTTASFATKALPQIVKVAGGNPDGYVVLGESDSAKAAAWAAVCATP